MESEVQHLDLYPDTYTEEYHKALLQKLIYLLENLSGEAKNSLFKSVIIKQRYERFNIARSFEGDDYFKQFLGTLSLLQLENLLLAIKPGLESNINDHKVAAVYNHIFHGTPVASTKTTIQEAIQIFGDELSISARMAEDAAYNEANIKYPARPLEERELKFCGIPFNEVFKKYLPLLGNDNVHAKFNEIIRELVKKHNLSPAELQKLSPTELQKISTYEFQKKLRFTTHKLIEVLRQRGFKTSADNLRLEVFGIDSADEKLDKINIKNKQNTFNHRLSEIARWIRSIFDLKPRINTREMPSKAEIITPTPDPVDVQKAHDLYSRMTNLHKDRQSSAKETAVELSPNKPDLTFAYDSRYKKIGNILPEDNGNRSKIRPGS